MTMSMFRCEITLSGDRGKQVRGIAAAQGLSAQDVCEALVIQGINKYYDYMDNAGATEKSSGSGSGSGSDDRFDRISEEIACSRSEVLNDLRNIWAAVERLLSERAAMDKRLSEIQLQIERLSDADQGS